MSPNAQLAHLLVSALEGEEAALDRLAELLATRISVTVPEAPGVEWLETRPAAEYLGLPSPHQLHKLTAARALPFSQERPGAKCYFRRSDLDAYRERHMTGAGRP